MKYDQINEHYLLNRDKYVKRFKWRAGTPEAAEDIVQEAYHRAMKYLSSLKDGDMDKWMNMILNNCLREFKNQEKGYSGVDWDEEDPAPEVNYPRHVMREVYDLIGTKSVDQIEVLMLYFKQEYTAKDISEITLHSYAKCHKIISRFREELRELYRE